MEKSNIEKQTNQPNIQQHGKSTFDSMIETALKENGLHCCASKGFGKTRLLFSIAQTIRQMPDTKVFIFDGSDAWLYNFSKIPVFNICETDISIKEQKTALDIEQYNFSNWQLVKLAINTNKDLLFRLKTRKPSKRGFAVRQIINYIDSTQRAEKEENPDHTPKNTIAYFIEEAQDSFNTRSTARIDSEEFLTVFNEARNQRESFFTASQRLNDFSKTIRTKQNYALGRINSEDRNPAIRAIEKDLNLNLAKMPLRNWLYNGQKFESPIWVQSGKPYIINRNLRALFSQKPAQTKTKEHNTLKFFKYLLFPMLAKIDSQTTTEDSTENSEDPEAQENSEADGLMTSNDPDDILMPADPDP
jgi:hypothetical protein